MQDNAIIYFDGLCEPNPGGVACCGYVIERNGRPAVKGYSLISPGPGTSNNLAEYTGAIMAMEKALEIGERSITLKGDSLFIINQLRGLFSVRSEKILPLYRKAKELSGRFASVVYDWIPRSQNSEADSLSKHAYQEFASAGGDPRKERAHKIFKSGLVQPVSDRRLFRVKDYTVDIDAAVCECMDYLYRKAKCKHIMAVEICMAVHPEIFRQAENQEH